MKAFLTTIEKYNPNIYYYPWRIGTDYDKCAIVCCKSLILVVNRDFPVCNGVNIFFRNVSSSWNALILGCKKKILFSKHFPNCVYFLKTVIIINFLPCHQNCYLSKCIWWFRKVDNLEIRFLWICSFLQG